MTTAERPNEYNGWTNYETWNVALYIGNDEGLQDLAKESGNYEAFRESLAEFGGDGIAYQTPDGVAWNDSGLDIEELDELIAELGS